MTLSDVGATSSSIISLIVPSPMPTLSLAPSLTLSPVSTTSGNLIHRPFAGGLLRVCRLVAADDFLPRPFATVGRRLVFSVGIIFLAITAGLLLFVFSGITERLI